MKKDPAFKLLVRMRTRIGSAFKSKSLKKDKATVKYLGCTKGFFQKWIAYQLTGDLTVENYGFVWHIDHVKPCASYDLNEEDQAKECFNWKNCRPLLGEENLEKSDKIDNKLIEEHKKVAQKFLKFWSDSGAKKVSA